MKNNLFSSIGIEPTFYPNITIPKIFWSKLNHRNRHIDSLSGADSIAEYAIDKACCRMIDYLHSYSDELGNNVSTQILSKWIERAYNDGGLVELPSPVFDDRNTLVSEYSKLVKFLIANGLISSSKYCMQIEGGCHINYKLGRSGNKNKMLLTMVRDTLLNHPSVLWTFLSPFDNMSSNIYEVFDDIDKCENNNKYRRSNGDINKNIEEYEKGCFMMWREKGNHFREVGTKVLYDAKKSKGI